MDLFLYLFYSFFITCKSRLVWLYTVPSAKTVDFPLLHSLANISVVQRGISTRYMPK